jgi:hypothetical protein
VFFSFNFKAYRLAARKAVYMIKLEGKELCGYPQDIGTISYKECGDEGLITFMGHHLPLVHSKPCVPFYFED